MQAFFVKFLSPGTFVYEESTKPIVRHDVELAKSMAREIKERYGAIPFGFQFITRERGEYALDSKITFTSGVYYLGGTVRTREQVERDNKADEEILRSNMRINDFKAIITNTNSWKVSLPVRDDDVVLDWP